MREETEPTKIRIVFDASACENERSLSLNDCLEVTPLLQNLMRNVLLRSRFNPIALAGALKKASLQVKIREEDGNVLKSHWIKDLQTQEVEVLRFTRALFGLLQSTFLLGATIEQHLNKFQEIYPEIV